MSSCIVGDLILLKSCFIKVKKILKKKKKSTRAPRSTVADSGTSVIAAAEAAHGVRRKRLTAGGRCVSNSCFILGKPCDL